MNLHLQNKNFILRQQALMNFWIFALILFFIIGDSRGDSFKEVFVRKTQPYPLLAQVEPTEDISNDDGSDEIDIESELSNLDEFDQEANDEFEEDLDSDLEGELEEESADLSEEELIDEEISAEQEELLLEEDFESTEEIDATAEQEPEDILEDDQDSPAENISEDESLAEVEEPVLSAPEEGPPINITDVDFLSDRNGGTIVIKTTGPPPTPFVRRSEDGRQIIVELSNTKVPDQFKRPYTTREFPSNIGFFQAYQESQSTTARFVVQIRGPVEPLIRLDGNSVLIEAQGPGLEQSLAEEDGAPPADVPAPTEVTDLEDPSSDSPPPSGPPLDAQTSEDLLSDNVQFSGKPISIEVTEANIRDVLEFIANDSGLNLILSDAVSGTISLKLREIPWDQAFLVVLQLKKLGYIKNGNILIVDSVEAIRSEIQERKNLLDSKKDLEPLQIQIVPISYAKAQEIIAQIQIFKSTRGQIQADQRTNSLIITDISENIDRMRKLIRTLDVQIPQVLIEGKIIEANENFDQRFGLLLTGQNLGATVTNFTAPSQTDGDYKLSFDLSEIVGLPPGALTGVLDMLENEDVVRVLSSPRVVTLNNTQAAINQTQQIPISQSNATAGSVSSGTEYKNLTFSLQVTPQVTSGEGIIMQIDIQREFAGASASQDAAPPVFGRSANTTVLVNNGDTAVIGGMYQTENTQNFQGLPVLKHIPLLGALFRKNFYTTSKTELLIFLTPRVLNRSKTFALNNNGGNNFDGFDGDDLLEESLEEVELEQEFDSL